MCVGGGEKKKREEETFAIKNVFEMFWISSVWKTTSSQVSDLRGLSSASEATLIFRLAPLIFDAPLEFQFSPELLFVWIQDNLES